MPARIRQVFPRGVPDFLLQLGIWLGFVAAYQLARGVADRSPAEAYANGRILIDAQRELHALVEPDLQRVVLHAGDAVVAVVNWTYWLSQFAVVGVALLWIYLFRNEAFTRIRNWIITANVLGLVGYVLVPTAPPRMFPEEGFVDTLAQASALNHGSGLVELASNPYAAMPSLHSADALIVGFALAGLVTARWAKLLWTLWPTWVWFSVMATGNHFWLDIAAGVGVAALAGTFLVWLEQHQSDRLAPALPGARRW
ncbi:MAG: phosphatase PAP2 family protein [Thermoleophilia bacterium]|nr:phosphatase PAP2 family protein [Thermoleophilia bacterium]